MTPDEALELSVQSDLTPKETRCTRIGVVGSRDWADRDLLYWFLDRLATRYGPYTVVSGACPFGGTDRMAEEWAYDRGMPTPRIYPPEKGKGGAAFAIRNKRIAGDELDMLCAFKWYKDWGEQRGTRMTRDFATEAGVPVWVIERTGLYYRWEG